MTAQGAGRVLVKDRTPDELVLVPIKTWIKPEVWRTLERFAVENETSVGVVIAHLVEKACAPRKQRGSARGSYRKMTPDLLNQIVRMYEAGRTYQSIAIELGLATSTVYNHLRRLFPGGRR